MRNFFIAALFVLTSFSSFAITREEALKFLYSSMSLPDKADYSEDFYLANIDASLRAKEELPWGKLVPEREFLHFVLPIRVNNENLDGARMVFYEELKDRVKGLSMKDAILEVNHWCHEKVTYKPSDARTSSPLSSVSQAIGRCGEESTFTVAALRSVGIPARQIYTPRWAHTDDNHAWVEAWADGEWFFLGACEPEPILNLAWFNDPASRGVLMTTNVVGDYKGPEEVLLKQPLSTRINVTSNYAPVAQLPVMVRYPNGSPAKGAKVNFGIYNYAEYYPAVTKTADNIGKVSLTAGLGDLIVWATDGKYFGWAKGNARDFDPSGPGLEIVLDKDCNYSGVFELDIVPPPSGAKLPKATIEQSALNNRRLHEEDSIRGVYMSTFADAQSARATASRLGVDADKLEKILIDSRGNHKIIVNALEALPAKKRDMAVALLLNVTEKDRRDISQEVIIDHVTFTDTDSIDDFNAKYILSPRIENEALTPWRSILTNRFRGFSDAEITSFRSNPKTLMEWVTTTIASADNENPQKLRMSPGAVLGEKKADALSINIFFVAMARSLGIPARIDPVTGTTQYSTDKNTWTDAIFANDEMSEDNILSKGKLNVTYQPEGYIVDPKYYSQFSISKIEDGCPRLLEFDEEGSVGSIFAAPYELDGGQYILTTGQRLANGGVLARSEIFFVKPDETTNIEMIIRQDNSELSVIGSLNAENIYHDLATGEDKSLLSTTGRGYYILGLISPNHEPTAHALNDISAVASALENSGRKIMLLFEDIERASRFDRNVFPNLPDNVVFGIDNDGRSRNNIIESLHLENPGEPIFVVADTFNRIVWVSTGYNIGLGETLLNTLFRVK